MNATLLKQMLGVKTLDACFQVLPENAWNRTLACFQPLKLTFYQPTTLYAALKATINLANHYTFFSMLLIMPDTVLSTQETHFFDFVRSLQTSPLFCSFVEGLLEGCLSLESSVQRKNQLLMPTKRFFVPVVSPL